MQFTTLLVIQVALAFSFLAVLLVAAKAIDHRFLDDGWSRLAPLTESNIVFALVWGIAVGSTALLALVPASAFPAAIKLLALEPSLLTVVCIGLAVSAWAVASLVSAAFVVVAAGAVVLDFFRGIARARRLPRAFASD